MKVTLILFLLSSQMALAAGPICDKIISDIKNIGDRISNFTGKEKPASASFTDLASEYDKALAEELLYNGLKEMLEEYEKSKKDLGTTTKPDYLETFKQISQEGIDVRQRLVVLKSMVEFSDKDKDEYEKQKNKTCANYRDPSPELANCQAKYHKYRPMITGYFQAIKKISNPKETLKLFNEEVAKINDAQINEELKQLEKTEAVKEQKDFFSKILLSQKPAAKDLDPKIKAARDNKMIAKNKLDKILEADELKNLMEVQKLLYERLSSAGAACIEKSPAATNEIYQLGCVSNVLDNPMGQKISYLVDTQYDITLFLHGANKPSEDTAVKNSAVNTLQKYCQDGSFVLTSCNIQTPQQKAAQQQAEEFHEKYYVETSSRRNVPDRIVKRKSFGSMLAQSAITSLTASDTMPFFMGAMTFNGQLDMMTQQAQWQKQYNYNMEQWNNAYMGNMYGGLNHPTTVFDPTLGGQNAANFGFNFTQI